MIGGSLRSSNHIYMYTNFKIICMATSVQSRGRAQPNICKPTRGRPCKGLGGAAAALNAVTGVPPTGDDDDDDDADADGDADADDDADG